MDDPAKILRDEIARYRCSGDDETPLIVIEYRLFALDENGGTVRRRPGPREVRLQSGEQLRVIDSQTFELPATGELIRRVD